MNIALTLVAVAASIIGSGMALPQARRLHRTGRIDGVSPTWIGVSLAINGWWTAYALAVSLWVIVPVSMISFVVYAWIGVVYLRAAPRRIAVSGLAVGVLGLGMAPLPVVVVGGWTAGGVAIGLCYGLQLAPAVVAALRSRELAGVSPGTWHLSFVEGVLWLTYGYAVGDDALVAGGIIGTSMAGAILLRLALTGHRPFELRAPRSAAMA